MTWSEAVFGQWGGVLSWAPVACVLAAVCALPSTLWSRFVKAPGWIGWVFSICAAAAIAAAVTLPWQMTTSVAALASPRRYAESWFAFVAVAAPLFLTLLLPQLLAYPLTRSRTWWRPAVAAALVLVGAGVWAGAGLVLAVAPG